MISDLWCLNSELWSLISELWTSAHWPWSLNSDHWPWYLMSELLLIDHDQWYLISKLWSLTMMKDGIRKDVLIFQVWGSAPAPPTLPVFRVVLYHTEASGQRLLRRIRFVHLQHIFNVTVVLNMYRVRKGKTC